MLFLSQFTGKFEQEHFDAIWYLLNNQSLEAENYFQYNFVFEGDEQIVDYLGKFETLQNDFDEICKRISIPHQQLPHENRTQHPDYRDLYCSETKDLVQSKFRKDIELLGYSF
ncbi:hypothetical protein ACFSJU_10010 [Paradesertivirga mongoliensis]|uniref:Uncharacterized protein n=1 Tax=Paradesertivirga mongoliensis TaxID=2100740 RepID=A0ABW4ZLC9_9SPHI|nr:hypothetical protein [Pedobacter mongoliensis]